ncbi:lycopene cyclase family protein [Siphonobacter sp.]|uniref:lycopene cyclase family protein n=1 Tax=Siphonobacter sp. TaxID=1869184 RepID=UPI003B3A090F
MKYDIIITGGGMAGLSLAYYLNHSTLRHKQILIIDREPKTRNDRTWAFWQAGEGAFESILYRHWNKLWFHGTEGFSQQLDLGQHQYKLLRGKDFYASIRADLSRNPNIQYLFADLHSVETSQDSALVQTSKGEYRAAWCFDSTTPMQAIRNLTKEAAALPAPRWQELLQHFKGWVVRTEKPVFDPETPIMMDFRIEQKNECRFVYVMPFSATEALVEFTLFTPALLTPNEYDEALRAYLKDFFSLETYEITEEETGIIPMSDEPMPEQPSPHVIRIGTAGGYTRASTGYTFTRTQKRLQALVRQLEKNFSQSPVTNRPISAQYRFYDQVLLNVFLKNRYSAAAVFTDLFRKNPAPLIFRFLDEETSLREDLGVLYSVPVIPFTMAAFDVFKRNISEMFKR